MHSALVRGYVCRPPDLLSLPSDEEWYAWDGKWTKSTSGAGKYQSQWYAGHTADWKKEALDYMLEKLASPDEVEWSARDTHSQCYVCKVVDNGLTKQTCGYELQKGISKLDTSKDSVTGKTITKINIFTTTDCETPTPKVGERVFYKAVTKDRLRGMQGFQRRSIFQYIRGIPKCLIEKLRSNKTSHA